MIYVSYVAMCFLFCQVHPGIGILRLHNRIDSFERFLEWRSKRHNTPSARLVLGSCWYNKCDRFGASNAETRILAKIIVIFSVRSFIKIVRFLIIFWPGKGTPRAGLRNHAIPICQIQYGIHVETLYMGDVTLASVLGASVLGMPCETKRLEC